MDKCCNAVNLSKPYPITVFDVCKALRLSGVPVHDDPNICNLACTGEELKELLLNCLQWQVVGKYGACVPVQLHKFSLSFSLLLDLWWRGCSPAEAFGFSHRLRRLASVPDTIL